MTGGELRYIMRTPPEPDKSTMEHRRFDHQWLLWNPSVIVGIEPHLFEPAYWLEQQAATPTPGGRGSSLFINSGQRHWVLRHYRRGGLIGKLIHDRYLLTRLKNTRVWRELALMQWMHAHGLPVTRAIGGRVVEHGMTYSADLLTETVPGSRDLISQLQEAPLTDTQWRAVGATIRRFHEAGVWHADLNARNLLMDGDGQIFLIDFDRGERRRPASYWQQQNLDRLARSFAKEQGKQPDLPFSRRDWASLLAGYAGQ